MALTTALENGAELVFALIVAVKERLSVGKNMQSIPDYERGMLLRCLGYLYLSLSIADLAN